MAPLVLLCDSFNRVFPDHVGAEVLLGASPPLEQMEMLRRVSRLCCGEGGTCLFVLARSSKAPLMLRNQDRLKPDIAVAWQFGLHRAAVGDHGLAGVAVACIGLLSRLELAWLTAHVLSTSSQSLPSKPFMERLIGSSQ